MHCVWAGLQRSIIAIEYTHTYSRSRDLAAIPEVINIHPGLWKPQPVIYSLHSPRMTGYRSAINPVLIINISPQSLCLVLFSLPIKSCMSYSNRIYRLDPMSISNNSKNWVYCCFILDDQALLFETATGMTSTISVSALSFHWLDF